MAATFTNRALEAYYGRDADRLQALGSRVDALFEAIATGDEQHRAWLKQAITDHLAGRPVQQEPTP
jgi:predicted NBD/HSP70 family sugar kinase